MTKIVSVHLQYKNHLSKKDSQRRLFNTKKTHYEIIRKKRSRKAPED